MKEFFVLIWIGMSMAVFADVYTRNPWEHPPFTRIVVSMGVAVLAPAGVGYRLAQAAPSWSPATTDTTTPEQSRSGSATENE